MFGFVEAWSMGPRTIEICGMAIALGIILCRFLGRAAGWRVVRRPDGSAYARGLWGLRKAEAQPDAGAAPVFRWWGEVDVRIPTTGGRSVVTPWRALDEAARARAQAEPPISEHESPQAFRALLLLPLPLVLVVMFVVRTQFAGNVAASAVLALALVIGAVLLICPTRYRCAPGEVTRIRFGRCARVDLTRPFTARRRSAPLAGCALVVRQGRVRMRLPMNLPGHRHLAAWLKDALPAEAETSATVYRAPACEAATAFGSVAFLIGWGCTGAADPRLAAAGGVGGAALGIGLGVLARKLSRVVLTIGPEGVQADYGWPRWRSRRFSTGRVRLRDEPLGIGPWLELRCGIWRLTIAQWMTRKPVAELSTEIARAVGDAERAAEELDPRHDLERVAEAPGTGVRAGGTKLRRGRETHADEN